MAAGDGCSAMALRAAGFTPAGPQANEPLLYASTLCDGGRAMVARRGETPPLVCTASEPLRSAGFTPAGPQANEPLLCEWLFDGGPAG